MLQIKINSKGFTLIELLVVIVIIGILATLATVGLNSVRAKARDSKRISDIRQMQSALELYFNDNNGYPTAGDFVIGTPLDSPDGTKTYMAKIPSNPKPWTEGACVGLGTEYSYTSSNVNTYQLSYCLANKVNDLPSGVAKAMPGNINSACTPSCPVGKYCGDSDGCGGACTALNIGMSACADGVPKCGAAAACSGTTDTCTSNVCYCGAGAACTGNLQCVSGTCQPACPSALTVAYNGVTYNTVWVDGANGANANSIEESGECWLKENLRTDKKPDGSALTHSGIGDYVYVGIVGSNTVTEESNMTDVNNLGYLYTWAVAMNLSTTCNTTDCSAQITANHQGLCPSGWHVPTNTDWINLINRAETIATGGGSGSASCAAGNTCTNAAKALKEDTTAYWNSVVSGTTNAAKFTARSAGYNSGNWYRGANTILWSSSQVAATTATRRFMSTTDSNVDGSAGGKGIYSSVRCVKN